MEFTNEITISQPSDEVFAALTDVERVASCLPGARVEGSDGDTYQGAMRVKVGPITADYRGSLTFDELDPDGHRAVLVASGQETNGQGSAQARIVSSVVDEADGARVVVKTELQVNGRVAQFGSGAMEKIAKRMFADFAKNLEQLMLNEKAASSSPSTSATPESVALPQAHVAPDGVSESLDVVGLVREPMVRSVRRLGVPVALALAVGFLFGRRHTT